MKIDIILAGVGGQGILSIAAIIGHTAIGSGLYLKQAEVHGMSQRGGDVQSHLRISDREIFSDLIPNGQADLILSVEPLEALRYMPYLAADGHIVTNSVPFKNIPNYPADEALTDVLNKLDNSIILDATQMAKTAGNARAMNMVMLGAASPFIDLPAAELENAIKAVFARKGEKIVQLNLDAFKAGREFSTTNK